MKFISVNKMKKIKQSIQSNFEPSVIGFDTVGTMEQNIMRWIIRQ